MKVTLSVTYMYGGAFLLLGYKILTTMEVIVAAGGTLISSVSAVAVGVYVDIIYVFAAITGIIMMIKYKKFVAIPEQEEAAKKALKH